MGTSDLLADMQEMGAILEGDILEQRRIPAKEPQYATVDAILGLNPRVRDALVRATGGRLYDHQSEAITLGIQSEDIVLEAPPASGKTLAFLAPMFHRIMESEDTCKHALLVYPMKALSNDQRRQMSVFSDGLNVESWFYDGDTDTEHRQHIRRTPPPILFTTPEMLHLSFLGHADLWDSFLRNLDFIVLDEIHEYRGYFGTNMAFLLRRFLAKLRTLNSYPQLFLCTATCANPLEHAQRLTGREMRLVQARDALRPHREFTFVNPRIPSYEFQTKFERRIAAAACACLREGLTTIIFCPSRRLVESIAKRAKGEAARRQLDAERIAPYRAGYTPEDRRAVENGLREGRYLVVCSTNALELGIDVGRLDVCILAGFPDNVMSAWQRIGRTGRSWQSTSQVFFFALNSAFDQFYVANLDMFLGKPLDEILIGTGNQELAAKHVPYFLHELDGEMLSRQPELSQACRRIAGETLWNGAEAARARITPARGEAPFGFYSRLDLRGERQGTYRLLCGSQEIGTISENHKFWEAYLGAVYHHQGQSYRVTGHD
ncbi:MAG: DEAD/DEAH box helicase, partial [Planctomycetes bacterium]|nr:DEAD/DEAH box helicase [Planctomycetota bacterium]